MGKCVEPKRSKLLSAFKLLNDLAPGPSQLHLPRLPVLFTKYRPPFCPSNTPRSFSPQGLCTCHFFGHAYSVPQLFACHLLLTPIASRLPSNSTSTDRPPDSPRPIHHAAILTPKRFSELCLLGRKYVCIVKIYAPLNTYQVGRYALECKLQRGRGFLLPRCPPMCLPRQVRCLVHRLINTY